MRRRSATEHAQVPDTAPRNRGSPFGWNTSTSRKGALNLFAAFNTRTGKVYGMTAERKRQVGVHRILGDAGARDSGHDDVDSVVLDNLRMHKGKQVQAWLAKHPRFMFHHPPVHCSWMNQVEQWFSIFQRKRLGSPTSPTRRTGGAAASVYTRVE